MPSTATHPQTTITKSILTGDIALQKAKVSEARAKWAAIQKNSSSRVVDRTSEYLISCSEAWDILTTERRILYYMECTEAAFDFMEDDVHISILV